MATVEELTQQVNELTRQLNEQRLATVPAEQRPLYQSQLEMEAERRALQEERSRLNQAAIQIHARELSSKTHLPLEEFTSFTSLAEMDQHAVNKTMEAFSNPELAKLILGGATGQNQENAGTEAGQNQSGAGTEAQTQTDPNNAPAAGASAQPAGAPGNGQGTQHLQPDPTSELLKSEHYGRGSGNLSDYLAQLRNQSPVQQVSFEPTPAAPAPELQPTQ